MALPLTSRQSSHFGRFDGVIVMVYVASSMCLVRRSAGYGRRFAFGWRVVPGMGDDIGEQAGEGAVRAPAAVRAAGADLQVSAD